MTVAVQMKLAAVVPELLAVPVMLAVSVLLTVVPVVLAVPVIPPAAAAAINHAFVVPVGGVSGAEAHVVTLVLPDGAAGNPAAVPAYGSVEGQHAAWMLLG